MTREMEHLKQIATHHFSRHFYVCIVIYTTINVILMMTLTNQMTNITDSYFHIEKRHFQPRIKPNHTHNETKFKYNLKSFGNTQRFASICQPEDLFRLKHNDKLNATIPDIMLTRNTFCPRRLSLFNSSYPLTALISFPGAGNTWMRHLIQQMTGIATGSVYSDPDLKANGFPFEGRTDNVIAVKTHGDIYQNFKEYIPVHGFGRLIVILRNPFDCFLSEFKRCCLSTYNNYIRQESKEWHNFLPQFVKMWSNFMRDTFDFDGPILVVFYEDLQTQLLKELIRIAEFLSSDDMLNEFSFCCVVKNKEGSFRRKSNGQTARDVFTIGRTQHINNVIKFAAKRIHDKFPEVSKRLLSYRNMDISKSKGTFEQLQQT